jgi:hypothetical protein
MLMLIEKTMFARNGTSSANLARSLRLPAFATLLVFALAACNSPPLHAALASDGSEQSSDAAKRFATTIRGKADAGKVATPLLRGDGSPIAVSCETCHAGGDHSLAARNPEQAKIHASVEIQHGGLTCDACHDALNRTQLHLADGASVPFAAAMTLCGQCHGTALRDYEHGSHGGMNGYWDLNRGPRERNSCLLCHYAHAPAYPRVMPAPPPRDRFFGKPQNAH